MEYTYPFSCLILDALTHLRKILLLPILPSTNVSDYFSFMMKNDEHLGCQLLWMQKGAKVGDKEDGRVVRYR